MECLGSETVALYITGDLAPAMRARAELHVDRCPTCRTWIARAARLQTRDAAESTAPDALPFAWPMRGSRIGRYVVGAVIGRGAMGVVLRAEDPVLGRSVALKLLHRAADGAAAHAMLLAEARNLARLSDPHVVQIFDVETWCGRLVIAMELVEGTSLRGAAEHATRRDRIRMLLLAARGLAAAHAGGVVHRDFKPDNVLVANDGRVLVGDFGLAMLADVERSDDEVLVGTPAYMPPEQHAGGAVDARADQFAFCVTATEILLGVRPEAIDGLRDAAAFATKARGLPGPLVRALVRGLASAPERRAPTMDTIISALERATPSPWTALAWTAVLAVPLVAALAIADTAPTQDAADIDDPQTLVHALVARAELALLDGDADGSEAELERAYMLARRERLDDDAASIALRLARSIHREKHRTDEAAEWLRRAETIAHGPQRAVVASTRARFELLRGRFDAAEAQCEAAIAELTGAPAASVDDVLARLRAAERAEDRHAITIVIEDAAAVWCTLGRCRDSVDASRAVVAELVATRGADHLEVAQSRGSLAGYLRLSGDPAGARLELDAAIAVLEREPRPDPYALAIATMNLALTLQQLGEPRLALDQALLGITRTEQVFGPTSANMVEPLLVSASLERTLGDGTAARRHLERALIAAEQVYGDEPNDITGRILLGLAYNAQDAEDVERARIMAERAVQVYDAVGVASIPRSGALGVLAWSHVRSDPARARALLLRQLTMLAELRERDDGLGDLVARQEAVARRTLGQLPPE